MPSARRDDPVQASGGPGPGPAGPYVGPRALAVGEPLFGRDRELAELEALVCAERVVLLHAPSGAGKSSLIHAGLVPRLRRRFDVWRPTRVGQPPPPDVPADSNRYALAAMLGLERGVPDDLRRPAARLAGLRLAEYVAGRPRRRGAPTEVLLVFDQFEEVLHVDPLALAAKRAVFAELGELLQDPRVWALFAIRDDYLARFEPYARALPTHLRTRYRLDLLGLAAAREAVVRPAAAVGVAWTAAALDRLIDDLARVKVQLHHGSFVEQVGGTVEPMQMQVVCRGLWTRLPAERRTIDADDVAAFGDVDAALAGYYAAAVERVAGGEIAAERALRAWVDERLITAEGVRSPVLRSAGEAGWVAGAGEARAEERRSVAEGEGPADGRIAGLVDAHLVRAEQRDGATWYELAHDRLVGPVRADNARWTAEHLAPVQVQAALWARQDRPAALLLSAEALAAAEAWAAGRRLGEPDAGYLAASRAARAEERALREAQARALAAAETVVAAQVRAARRQRVYLAVVAAVGALAVLAALLARRRAAEAQAGAREAAEAAEVERAEAVVAADQARMLAAREAVDDPTVQAVLLREVERATDRTAWLQAALDARTWPLAQAVVEHEDSVLQVGFLADGRLITASLDHRARIVAPGGGAPRVLRHAATVNRCAGSPDGALVVTASDDGTAAVWRADTGERVRTLTGHADEVWWAEFSPDGRRVLTASKDRTARVWATDGAGEPVVLAGHDDDLLAAEWSPDGARVLTASVDGAVRVAQADGGGEPVALRASRAQLYAARFAPDGQRFVTAGADRAARVWRADGGGAPLVLDGHDDTVRRAVFSPDGRRVLTGTQDAEVWVWPADGSGSPRVIHGLSGAINAIAFAPDGRFAVATQGGEVALASGDQWTHFKGHAEGALDVVFSADGARLASAGWDPDVRVWRVADGDDPLDLYADDGPFAAVALSADGRRVAGAAGRGVRVWATSGERAPVALDGHGDRVLALAFAPDGARVASGGEDRSLRVWPSDGAGEPVVLAGLDGAVRAIAWAPDGGRVAAAAGFAVHVWASAGGAAPVRLDGHAGAVVGVAFSPDGSRVLTASHDATARVWRADGAGEPVVLAGHRGALLSATFSPDGARVLSVGDDLRVRVWRADGGGEPVVLFGAHDDAVVSAAFTPDGAGVLTASSDGRALLWRADGGGAPVAFAGHAAGLTSAVFSRDGALIVTGSQDRTARVWRRASGESLVLASVGGGPVRGVDVSPDGDRVLVWNDEFIRLWTLRAPAELQAHFWRATPYCLPAEQRARRLGESADEAARRSEACAARAAREAAP